MSTMACHGMPWAWWRAEGADTMSLCLAQDVTEVDWGSACHSVCHFICPTEVFLLDFVEDLACHVHSNAR